MSAHSSVIRQTARGVRTPMTNGTDAATSPVDSGATSSTCKLVHYWLIRDRVVGKVMFSHACVILSTGDGGYGIEGCLVQSKGCGIEQQVCCRTGVCGIEGVSAQARQTPPPHTRDDHCCGR